MTAPSDDELAAGCTRFLRGHGRMTPAELLAELVSAMPDLSPDNYGDGGVVSELESEIAALLGKPAALFLPSGVMAQQIAMRIHADARHHRTIAFHPTCHLQLHEGQAYQRLHRLVGRPVGSPERLFTLSELEAVAEPLAAVLWELPQREIGGLLPEWDDLVAQVAWASQSGAATHLDGARLWECTPYYRRPPAEIAALFDTVYVSLYKGLGGLSGCCLAGPEDVVQQAREWRLRHGGTLYALWPYAASGLVGLRRRLPLMPAYAAHAVAIATELRSLPRVHVLPDPPPTPLLQLHLQAEEADIQAAVRRLAVEQGIWVGGRTSRTGHPAWQQLELSVGDATLGFEPTEVRDLVSILVAASPA